MQLAKQVANEAQAEATLGALHLECDELMWRKVWC